MCVFDIFFSDCTADVSANVIHEVCVSEFFLRMRVAVLVLPQFQQRHAPLLGAPACQRP